MLQLQTTLRRSNLRQFDVVLRHKCDCTIHSLPVPTRKIDSKVNLKGPCGQQPRSSQWLQHQSSEVGCSKHSAPRGSRHAIMPCGRISPVAPSAAVPASQKYHIAPPRTTAAIKPSHPKLMSHNDRAKKNCRKLQFLIRCNFTTESVSISLRREIKDSPYPLTHPSNQIHSLWFYSTYISWRS